MPELTNHEINVAIARMMPGIPLWAILLGGKPPYFWLENETTVMVKWSESEKERIWSPVTDLNDAAEAVRAICSDSGMKSRFGLALFRAWRKLVSVRWWVSTHTNATNVTEMLVMGPRAWCEALLKLEAAGGN